MWFYGVMVSTQDSESCDPSSSLGRTFRIFDLEFTQFVLISSRTPLKSHKLKSAQFHRLRDQQAKKERKPQKNIKYEYHIPTFKWQLSSAGIPDLSYKLKAQ